MALNGIETENLAQTATRNGNVIVVEDLVADLRYGFRAAGAGVARRFAQHPPQRVRGDHGAFGLRQIHAHESHWLPRYAVKGRYWLNGQLVSELNDDELARIRNKEIGQ